MTAFPYEYIVKPTQVWNLTQGGGSTKGWRVEYRLPGVRRWTRFLLTSDAPLLPGDFETAITRHAEKAAA